MDDDVTRAMPAPGGGWESTSDGAWLLDAASQADEVPPPAGSGLDESDGDATAPVTVDVPGADAPTAPAALSAPEVAAGAQAQLDVRNEALPEQAPTEGTGPLGVVPAISAQRRWAKEQLANWRLFLVRFLCAGLAVIAAVVVVPGLSFTSWRSGQFATIAIIFGLLNATVKPALQFLVLRFILSTYGVVVVVINTILLAVLGRLMREAVTATGVLPLLMGGLLVGVFGLLFETLLGANPPVLDRDYKERNALK